MALNVKKQLHVTGYVNACTRLEPFKNVAVLDKLVLHVPNWSIL